MLWLFNEQSDRNIKMFEELRSSWRLGWSKTRTVWIIFRGTMRISASLWGTYRRRAHSFQYSFYHNSRWWGLDRHWMDNLSMLSKTKQEHQSNCRCVVNTFFAIRKQKSQIGQNGQTFCRGAHTAFAFRDFRSRWGIKVIIIEINSVARSRYFFFFDESPRN